MGTEQERLSDGDLIKYLSENVFGDSFEVAEKIAKEYCDFWKIPYQTNIEQEIWATLFCDGRDRLVEKLPAMFDRQKYGHTKNPYCGVHQACEKWKEKNARD